MNDEIYIEQGKLNNIINETYKQISQVEYNGLTKSKALENIAEFMKKELKEDAN